MSGDQQRELARKTLLSTDEVCWYIEHLETVQQNRKKGARRAAETRARKKQQKSKSECENSVNVECVIKSGRRKQMKLRLGFNVRSVKCGFIVIVKTFIIV